MSQVPARPVRSPGGCRRVAGASRLSLVTAGLAPRWCRGQFVPVGSSSAEIPFFPVYLQCAYLHMW